MPVLYLDCISRCNPLAVNENPAASRQSNSFAKAAPADHRGLSPASGHLLMLSFASP
jgi:hypothetical protein